MKYEYETYQEFFEQVSKQCYRPLTFVECYWPVSMEEMYQHFKARLLDELKENKDA